MASSGCRRTSWKPWRNLGTTPCLWKRSDVTVLTCSSRTRPRNGIGTWVRSRTRIIGTISIVNTRVSLYSTFGRFPNKVGKKTHDYFPCKEFISFSEEFYPKIETMMIKSKSPQLSLLSSSLIVQSPGLLRVNQVEKK